MDSKPCPVCGSNDLVELHPSEVGDQDVVDFSYSFSPHHNTLFRTVRCQGCTHVYCTPIPEDIAHNYEDVVDHEYLRHSQSRQLAGDACLATIKRFVPTGRVLDIGCATGDFLESAARAGYDAEGLELSRWSSQIAREKGFTVHGEPIEVMSERLPEHYDVVTLWGVIEHFADPADMLQHIRAVMKPGGVLAIWTGGVDGLMARALGRRWWHWQGQHIQYFTKRSLRQLLESNGLSQVADERYPFGATFDTVSNSLRRYRGHAVLQALARPMFAIKPTWYLRLPGELFVVARRDG